MRLVVWAKTSLGRISAYVVVWVFAFTSPTSPPLPVPLPPLNGKPYKSLLSNPSLFRKKVYRGIVIFFSFLLFRIISYHSFGLGNDEGIPNGGTAVYVTSWSSDYTKPLSAELAVRFLPPLAITQAVLPLAWNAFLSFVPLCLLCAFLSE